tara:strand:- start:4136 stop:5977 length:1842 start_codon:yes stop_codon:yes gene_type:complete
MENRDYWWKAGSSEMSERVFSIVEFLAKRQPGNYDRNLRHLRLYSNRVAQALSSRSYSVMDNRADKLKLNVIGMVIDAVSAQIGSNRPRPQYMTIAGNFKLRQQAELLTQFMNGQFYATSQYEKSESIFRDACIYGTGIQKTYRDGDDIGTERVLPFELLVDEIECRTESPRSMYQIKDLERNVVIDSFPAHKKTILNAEYRSFDSAGSHARFIGDMITVVEAWHLPSGPHAKDGKHVIACSNGALVVEKYEREEFPFSFFRWKKPSIGFWGTGVAEELQSLQVHINQTAIKIQEHMDRSSGQMWVKKGSGIGKGTITSATWPINTYRDQPPTMMTPSPINPAFLQWLEFLYAKAFEQIGMSQMAATSIKPAGLNSGESLRVYHDVGSARFTDVGIAFENFHLDVCKKMAAVASDIVADGSKNLRVLADGDRGIKEIDFKAISIDKTKYQLQGAPVNFLSGTPAGKIASLRDLAQIDPSIARQAMPGLGIPDLDKIRDLTNAPRNIVDKYVELILDKGEFIPPDPIMDLDTARQQATLHLQLAIIENSPEDRVELLRLWITSLDELQELAEQPPEGAMPPGAEEAPQEQLDPAAMDPAMLEQIAMMNPNQEPM